MMAALLAFVLQQQSCCSLDWVVGTYHAVSPQLTTFLQSEEFYLPVGAIGLTAMAVLIGWRAKAASLSGLAKALATGHRLRNAKAISREEHNMKVARQIRLEDAILKAIDGMIADKTMNHGQARNAFNEFANRMNLSGLRLRTKTWWPLRGRKLEALRKKTSEGLKTLRETNPLKFPVETPVVVNLQQKIAQRSRVKQAA